LVVFASCKDTDFASFLPKFLSIFIGYGTALSFKISWIYPPQLYFIGESQSMQ
jgi:hypothetical protein